MAATNQISTSPYLLSDSNQASYRYNGEIPPDEALEQQALNRRQHIANLLIQQGLSGSGQGQMVGRFYVPPSPIQGLSDLAKVGLGAYGTYKNDEARGELATKNQQILADAVAKWKKDSADQSVTTELEGPGAPIGQSAAQPPTTQASPQAQLESLLGPDPDQSNLPKTIPNDMQPAVGGVQIHNPNTGGMLPPPATPPIPSWANMGAMSGQEMSPSVAQGRESVATALAGVTEGPRPTSTATVPRTAEEKRAAIIENFFLTQHPQARMIGQTLLSELDKTQAREDTQAFQKSENAENRASRAETNKLLLEQKGDALKAQMQGINLQLQDRQLGREDRDRLEREKQEKDLEFKKWQTQFEGSIKTDVATIGATSKTDVAGMNVDKAHESKAPPGYRFTKDGNLETIPGGPADQKTQNKAAGQETVNGVVSSLRDQYKQLQEGGGITDTTKGALSNLGAGLSSSSAGQTAGKMFGTQNQSLRNTIVQQRPLLLQAIMKATGMSAKQMDSNVELKLYLSTATDPTLDVGANMRALDMIEKLYGGEATATQPATSMTPTVPAFHDEAKQKRYDEWKKQHKP